MTPIRILTASALFDGHDAAINMIRRLLQDAGAEVVHMGHNRSVQQVVKAALEEGVHGICVSSYQGGHMEYFKYLFDELKVHGASHIKLFGGGGGVILPAEKRELERYGIAKIFHPDDGRSMGLAGMIQYILESCRFELPSPNTNAQTQSGFDPLKLALTIAQIESGQLTVKAPSAQAQVDNRLQKPPIVGFTGTGGAGKSSLIDELLGRLQLTSPQLRLAVVCVDPTKRKTGGGLLGDRIRMNHVYTNNVFMRSMASRGSGREISDSLEGALRYLQTQPFDLIFAETSGIGQGSSAIADLVDLSVYVMTSEYGAPGQLEKIDMIDLAQFIVVNKGDRRGSEDALRDVSKQFRRSRNLSPSETVPVYRTQASQFNDKGLNEFFSALAKELSARNVAISKKEALRTASEQVILPAHRQAYLSEIVHTLRSYKERTHVLAEEARVVGALEILERSHPTFSNEKNLRWQELLAKLSGDDAKQLESWDAFVNDYRGPDLKFEVRGAGQTQPLQRESLSRLAISRVTVPKFRDLGDRLTYIRHENVPGRFPFTAGVFPLKRLDEEAKRMFAGEGTPERTNRRFHFLCRGEESQRLSTAFDSVTLYGEDPSRRPDIFGKIGESGVSVCTLEDMKNLYAGFDLCSPKTSVSMTINGPAPIILAFFFNAAIDQQIEKSEGRLGRSLTESERRSLVATTLENVRGTVQADILKEDQGQNTCIFSIPFALKMMGDIQEYFVRQRIRNFYSVSISGYHIAEAGANPISQLAFTLSNGFTFVEYYLSRGLKIDEFSPNLSFFFSNGLDPEYTVLGRVARRIWAIVMRDLYGANERSQKLKYHIQTSGRSLHAQEMGFNDIRTTLQALLAIMDHTNSLHTNAYDEAVTTPTEESVRRAMAIQLIINRELGLTLNENPLQGSFFIDQLTDAVEEAVLQEFLKIHERGGVLGAMETQYQRSQIQEQSLHYEELKHSGKMPLIGVNTFVQSEAADPLMTNAGALAVTRATLDEKNAQLSRCEAYQAKYLKESGLALAELKRAALAGENIFASLMAASRFCTLKQMSTALFEVGGEYRRNM